VLLLFLPLLPGALENSDKEERINCMEKKAQRSAKNAEDFRGKSMAY